MNKVNSLAILLVLAASALVIADAYNIYTHRHSFHVGMIVSNDFCTGRLVATVGDRGMLFEPKCGNDFYSKLWVNLDELKEVRNEKNK